MVGINPEPVRCGRVLENPTKPKHERNHPMPDWCYNRVSIPDEKDLEYILKPYLKEWVYKNSDEESESFGHCIRSIGLDFNKIIPMPEGIRKTMSDFDDDDIAGRVAFDRRLKRLEKLNLKNYGFKDWYHWSIEHWGTKWNGRPHGFDEDGRELSFSTAWNPPYPVIDQLAKLIDRPVRMRYISEVDTIEFEGLYTAFPNGNSEHLRQVDDGEVGKLITTVRKVVDRPKGFSTGSLKFDGGRGLAA
jgi:hypothetical protein